MHLRLRGKLIVLFVTMGTISIFLLGLVLHLHLKRERLNSIESDLNGQLRQIEFVIQEFFSNIDSLVQVLADNPLVRASDSQGFTNFTLADESSFTYRIGPTEQKIIDLFASIKKRFPYVNSVYMGRDNGDFIRSHKRARPTRYDPRQRPWYKLAQANPGRVMRTEAYRSVTTENVNIGTVTALVDDRGAVYGVVGIDVTLAGLTEFITKIWMDFQGQLVLIDRRGDVLASKNPALKGRNVREIFPVEAESILTRETGCAFGRGEAGSFYLCHVASPFLGWRVLALTPMKVIQKETWNFSAQMVSIFIALGCLLGIMILHGLQRFVVSRVKALSQKAEEITRTGNLEARVAVGSADEIGRLGGAFNQMVSKLHETREELRRHSNRLEDEVRERTLELRQKNDELQAQIERRTQIELDLKIQKAYLEQLFALSPEAIALIDIEGVILRVNAEFSQVFGYPPEEVVGRSLDEVIVPAEKLQERRALTQKISEGRKILVETQRRHKDGHLIDVSVTGTSVALGGSNYGVYAIYRDISERKRHEDELRLAKEAAESADRLKSAFLASTSHELRTPLNSIIGFTGILLQGLVGPLNEEQAKQLGMVKTSAHHLLNLINDVLDISKIEAGQLEVAQERFDVPEAVERAMKSLTPLAEKKGLDLIVNLSGEIGEMVGDDRRFEQVLLNLVNNALKFTDQGRVTVNVSIKDSRLEVEVRDTGIGIKAEDMGSLFKAFQQADTGLTRRYEGTGLGLSISKKLVGLLGGEIRAESDGPDQGAKFTFWLPLEGVGQR